MQKLTQRMQSKKGESRMDVLKKICEYLECDIGDIVEFKKSEAK